MGDCVRMNEWFTIKTIYSLYAQTIASESEENIRGQQWRTLLPSCMPWLRLRLPFLRHTSRRLRRLSRDAVTLLSPIGILLMIHLQNYRWSFKPQSWDYQMSANQPFSTRSRKPKALKQQIILFARYVLSDLSLISYSFMMFLSLTFVRFLFENQIEPNVGIVSVPDPKLPVLEKLMKVKR